MSRIFWATEPTEKLGAEIERKIVEYNAYLLSIGRWELWRRAMRLVYGSDPDSGRQTSRVTFGGKEGEIVQARGNTLMKLLRSYHTLVYGSRPAFEPRTIADDSAATETSVIGRALLDYALSKRRIESATSTPTSYAPTRSYETSRATGSSRTTGSSCARSATGGRAPRSSQTGPLTSPRPR
jgi:hypothetical protein